MKKILDFFKTNAFIAKWTIGYIFVIWLILKYIFNFDMFSSIYWWKFFHATLHGFSGFVFGALIYSMIPIYIASVIIMYRKKEPIITIPYLTKIKDFISLLFAKKIESVEQKKEEQTEPINEETTTSIYPDNLPSELRVPYMRAKNHMSLSGSVSVYNKQKTEVQQNTPEQIMENASDNFPLPNDFDIENNTNTMDNFVPTFTEINFDEPMQTAPTLTNNTTKYFESKNTEFETYREFVATKKYLIYEHSDNDFWVMDDDTWFATGKQIDSPIKDLISLAKQNDLIPVLYLESQNIMNIEETINRFETNGIKVIKSLDELD